MATHSADSLEAETLRKKLGDETLRGTFFPLVKNDCSWPEFINHLAARPTRRARGSMIVRHGDGFDFEFWSALSDSGKNRGTLGAVSHSVRCILDVASDKDLPPRGENSSTYFKVRERRIGIFHHLARCAEQSFARDGRQFCVLHSQIDLLKITWCAIVTPDPPRPLRFS